MKHFSKTDTFILGFFLGAAILAGAFSTYFIGEKVGYESARVSFV